jgi:hypothetical protein
MKAVVGRHLFRKILDFEPDHFHDGGLPAPPELVQIRNHDAVQNTATCGAVFADSENADFFNERGLGIMSLQFFGINIFAVGKYDDVFAPPRDAEIAVGINEAKVSGEKPSALDGGCSFGGITVVPLHDDRPANQNLSNAFIVRFVDADRDATDRTSNRADAVGFHRRDRRSGRSFRQTVSLKQRVAEVVEILCNFRIEMRAAAGQ